MEKKLEIQSNSVIANTTGLWKYVRYNHEAVITVNIYVVNLSFGNIKLDLNYFVITVNYL